MAFSMGAMAIGGSIMGGVGSGMASAAARNQGIGQQQASDYSATVLDMAATASRAHGSQEGADIARRTQLTQSDLRARAAASGAGTVTPTTVALEQGIAGRGEFNILSAEFSGEERARGLENQATLDRYMGVQQRAAGDAQGDAIMLKGISSALSSGSSIFGNYGGGGFSAFMGARRTGSLPSAWDTG